MDDEEKVEKVEDEEREDEGEKVDKGEKVSEEEKVADEVKVEKDPSTMQLGRSLNPWELFSNWHISTTRQKNQSPIEAAYCYSRGRGTVSTSSREAYAELLSIRNSSFPSRVARQGRVRCYCQDAWPDGWPSSDAAVDRA